MSDVVTTLKAARNLITKRKNWIKGSYAKTSPRGVVDNPCSPYATCWCAMGALEHVAHKRAAVDRAADYLIKVMNGHVTKFNDMHTHVEVLAAFDAAIKLAEKGA